MAYSDTYPMTQGPDYSKEHTCPEGFSLCPAELEGGCCPKDRSCGLSSCYATTAAPMSVCSKSGWIACGIEEGGGCCPSGHLCRGNGCLPASGAYSQMCSTGFNLCPEAVGFGCCRSGLACGKGYCYETTYPTVTLTEMIVSRDGSQNLITATSTITTAYQVSTVPMMDTTAGPTRIIPTETAVPKIPAVKTGRSGGGLSKGAMNGIIAGAVLILVVIVVGAWLIIRRLNHLARLRSQHFVTYSGSNPGHKHHLSGDSGNSGVSGGEMAVVSHNPMPHNNMSVDPLFSASGSSTPRYPRPSMSHGNLSQTDLYGYGSSPPPIPAPYVNQGYPQGSYDRNGSYSDQNLGQPRHASIDSGTGSGTYSPSFSGPAGEMSREAYLRDQNMRFGHDSTRQSLASTHGRQWSDVSDNSVHSDNPPSEIDGKRVSLPSPNSELFPRAGADANVGGRPSGERRNRSWTFMPAGAHHRKRGSNAVLNLNTYGYGPSSTPLSGGGRLEGVAEAETDASHSSTILGRVVKRKDGNRPRATTKVSDTSTPTVRMHQERSNSEGMIPQIMYKNQEESHSLPTVPDSPPRAIPKFTGPLSPRSSVHLPVDNSTNKVLVTNGVDALTGTLESTTEGGETKKKEVMVETREVSSREL